MNGYTTRFEQQQGHWMVMERALPLRREDLDPLQLGMLQFCNIAGLLPLQVESLDGFLQLRYPLTGSRMLSHYARGVQWSMEDVMNAIGSLADAVDRCQDHMLNMERMILHDDYIFVGEGVHDLRFVYMPIVQPLKRSEFLLQLERLIVTWFMRTTEPDGRAMQQLLRMVASDDFIPVQLKQFIRRYLSERAVHGHAEEFVRPVEEKASDVFPSIPSIAHETVSANRGRWFESPAEDPQTVSGLLGGEPSIGRDEQSSSSIPGGMPIGRWRTWLSVLTIFAAASIWRFLYASHPGQRSLILAMGLTVLCMSASAYLWNGWPHRARHSTAEASSDSEREWPPLDVPHEGRQEIRPTVESDNENGIKPKGGSARFTSYGASAVAFEAGDARAAEPASQQAVRPLNQTQWLSPGRDATVLLSAEQGAPERPCYLEWETTEQRIRIALQGTSLIIGRSSEAAQHVDETSGVSRAHLEMQREADAKGWVAKDLGSRNGSWINGNPMTPYEPYPLEAGDRLQVASSVYRFQSTAT